MTSNGSKNLNKRLETYATRLAASWRAYIDGRSDDDDDDFRFEAEKFCLVVPFSSSGWSWSVWDDSSMRELARAPEPTADNREALWLGWCDLVECIRARDAGQSPNFTEDRDDIVALVPYSDAFDAFAKERGR
jgi:hypothetical protein